MSGSRQPSAAVVAAMTATATAWVNRVSGASHDEVMAAGGDVAIGGGGVRASLAEYLVLLEALAAACGVEPVELLRLRPPYTLRSLIDGAADIGGPR